MFRTQALFAATLAIASASTAHAADYCQVFRDKNRLGTSVVAALPAVTAGSPEGWSNTSKRLSGAELLGTPGIHAGVSSAVIVALDSDVTLYLHERDDFDGLVRAFRCDKGRTCTINDVGAGFDNQTRSIDCSREYTGPAALDNLEIPTQPIAAAVRDTFATQMAAMNVDSSPTRTWVAWSTAHTRERRLGRVPDGLARYRDELRIFHALTVHTPWPAPDFDIEITMDFRPVLVNGALQMWWAQGSVFVEDTIFTDADAIRAQVFAALSAAKVDQALVRGIQEGVGRAFVLAAGGDPRSSTLDELRRAGADLIGTRQRLQLRAGCGIDAFTPTSGWLPMGGACNLPTAPEAYAPFIVLNKDRLAH